MRDVPGSEQSVAEQKFWTKVKMYFTTLEEHETVDQQDMIWIYLVILAASIGFIAGAFGLISSLLA